MKKIFLMVLFLTVNQSVIAEDEKVPDIKEGMWELTYDAEISGIPGEMPPMSSTAKKCLNKKDAMDPRAMLKNENCEISNLKIESNTASWNMSCAQENIKMTGDGTINYQHESFNGVFNMSMQGAAGGMKIVTKTTGRYIGACKTRGIRG